MDRRQAIILTNAGVFLFGPLGIYFSGLLIETNTFRSGKVIWNNRLQSGVNFVSTSMS